MQAGSGTRIDWRVGLHLHGAPFRSEPGWRLSACSTAVACVTTSGCDRGAWDTNRASQRRRFGQQQTTASVLEWCGGPGVGALPGCEALSARILSALRVRYERFIACRGELGLLHPHALSRGAGRVRPPTLQGTRTTPPPMPSHDRFVDYYCAFVPSVLVKLLPPPARYFDLLS